MKTPFVSFVLLLFCTLATGSCLGQGTLQPLTVTFDGPPYIAPGTSRLVSEYFESGVWFRPAPPERTFIRIGGGVGPNDPVNGTAFLQAGLGDSVTFSFTSGATFDLVSVDLAQYSRVAGPVIVHFVGYRHDGTTVVADVPISGLTFHTVFFDSEFTGLDRVEIPYPAWSLDNLIVSVPEPGTGLLLLAGGLWFAWAKRTRPPGWR